MRARVSTFLIRVYSNADLLRAYCASAREFGQQRVEPDTRMRRVTVIVNRWAGDK